MIITKKIVNNVPVTILKTNKFKSVTGTIYFKSKITKQNATYRRMLKNILIESCSKYPTHEKLYINSLENYDSYYSASSSRYGNYIVNSFTFASLKDKYTKKGNLKNVISTFCEMIFNPLVKDGKFDEETFDIIKKAYKSSLEKIKEDSSAYCEKKVFESLNPKKAYSFMSEIKYLDKMTAKSLYDDYLNMISNSEIELIFSDDIDDDIIEIITSKVKENKKHNEALIINNDDEEDKLIIKNGVGYGTQNILSIVCYLKNLSFYELNYVAPLYRIILGGSGTSRLFDNIREKNSLAYYVFARLEKDDSLIEIIMGIEKKDYQKAKELTFSIIKNMVKISDEELENAKKEIITALLDSQDSMFNITSRQFNAELFNLPNIDEYISNLKKVSKDDIETLASKIKPNLCYFLKGESRDE